MALALAATGCATVQKPVVDKTSHVQFSGGEWRVCQGDACRAHIRKTVIVAAPQLPAIVPLPQPMPTVAEKQKIIVTVHFATGQSIPTPDGRKELQSALEQIHQSAVDTITVTGFTDSRGSRSLNARLAQKRSMFVNRWLIRNGVKNHIIVNSKGGCCYIVGNDTKQGRALNRRVEININITIRNQINEK